MAKISVDPGKKEFLDKAIRSPGRIVLLAILGIFLLARIVSYFLFPNFLASSGLLVVFILVAFILLVIFTDLGRKYEKNSTGIRHFYNFTGIASCVLAFIVIAGNITSLVFEILANNQNFNITSAVWSMIISLNLGAALILFGISHFAIRDYIEVRLSDTKPHPYVPFDPLYVISFVLIFVFFAGFTAVNYIFGVGGPAILRILMSHVPTLYTFELVLPQPIKFYSEMGDIALTFILIILFFVYAVTFLCSLTNMTSLPVTHDKKVVVKEVIKEVIKEVPSKAKTKTVEKIVEKVVTKEVPATPKKEVTPIKEKTFSELASYYDELVKEGFLTKDEKEARLDIIKAK